MTENTIRTVKVNKVIDECKGVKTIIFNMKTNGVYNYIVPKPGQFVMVWVPGIDEIPMSISNCDDIGNWAITVKNVGECTNAIYNLKIGDYIGIRGPLGNHYKIPDDSEKEIFLIGGGIGMAPLKFLSTDLLKRNIKHTIIEGAKISNDLIFIEYFKGLNVSHSKIHFCTDDGSYGTKGVVSDVFKRMIKELSKSQVSKVIVYSCGPERMLFKLFQICQEYHIEFYASLERIMRCGCGLCGLCTLDPIGLLVCKDGPIFDLATLKKIQDFGKYQRDFTGKKIIIE
ncbi:MAG: dihydroorotate dehydrogenase electron transfer subunit [Candidatus Thorarchaeota archaeon]